VSTSEVQRSTGNIEGRHQQRRDQAGDAGINAEQHIARQLTYNINSDFVDSDRKREQ